jgi:DNA repair protein REV1
MSDKDPYGAIKFGEFRKYMQNKQSKLKEQEAVL